MAKKKKPAAKSINITDLQEEFGVVYEQDYGFLPFRTYAMNLLVGGMGLRRGQFVEIFGPEGSGKSTLLYEILGISAALGDITILADQEKSADPARLAKFGLTQGGNLLVTRGPYLEALFDNLQALFRRIRETDPGKAVVVGLDSVGITLPHAHYAKYTEGKLEEHEKTAANAKAWAKVLRAFFSEFYDLNITFIALNHQTQVISTSPFGGNRGPKYTTPGGQTQKHMMFTRIGVHPCGKIKNKAGVVIGNEIKVKTHKCKDAPPFQECRVPLYFGNPVLGADVDYAGTYDAGACFLHLKDRDIIKTAGGWSKLPLLKQDGTVEEVKFQGEMGFRLLFEEHRDAVYYTMLNGQYGSAAFSMEG